MALLDSPDIYGYTLFCDDIRQEADGKFTFVGVYANDMIVHVPFPLTLPKFAFAVTLIQQRKIFNPNISFRIYLPGDPSDTPSIHANAAETKKGVVEAELDARAETIDKSLRSPEEEKIVVLRANLILTSLVIKTPGVIRVRATHGENTIRLGGLRVIPAPAQTNKNLT